jgi:hypothetical protein
MTIGKTGFKPLVAAEFGADVAFETIDSVAVQAKAKQYRQHVLGVKSEADAYIVRRVLDEFELQYITVF